MIVSYGFSNFFSFRDQVDISFKVGKTAPDNNHFITIDENNRLSKVMAVFGPNASGKTNLLKGLAFIKWFMLDSFKDLKPDEDIAFLPFDFDEKKEKTRFNIDFIISNILYRYEFTISQNTVCSENLYHAPNNKFKNLFKRTYDINKKIGEFEGSLKKSEPGPALRITPKNVSIFSVLLHLGYPQIVEIADCINSIQTNISASGKTKTVSPLLALSDTALFYNEHQSFLETVRAILKNNDLGLDGIRIENGKTPDDKTGKETDFSFPFGVHIIDKKEYYLPFSMESAGTQNLFVLLRTLLPVLDSGGIAIIDEIESDLHPHMLPEIIKLFTDKKTNPKNAQLFFSTHCSDIMRELDKTQIVLVEKDETYASDAWRLDSMKGVRRDNNLYAKYMSGAYGAIPNI